MGSQGGESLTIAKLNDLIDSGQLTMIRKAQRDTSSFNYYITPKLTFTLYNATVFIRTPQYIVFKFSKTDCLNLLLSLRAIDARLKGYLFWKYGLDKDLFTDHPIASEDETHFTIRCHLPQYKNKYLIHEEWEGQEVKFMMPNVGKVYKSAYLELKNIWENGKRLGYNIELKQIKNG